MVSWVFFDLGGVLVDEDALHDEMASVIARLAPEYGLKMTKEEIAARFQKMALDSRLFSPRVFIDSLIKDKTLAEEALARYRRELWPRFPELMRVRDGALDVLKSLAATHSLAMIANQPKTSRRFIDAAGITALMKFTLLSEEIGMAKPDIKIFNEAFRRCRVPGRECAMVGDRVDMDVAPAKRLGMRTVRMRAGLFGPVEPKDDSERADADITDLRELPRTLASLKT